MSNGLEAVTVAEFLWEVLSEDATIQNLLGGDLDRIAMGTLPFGAPLPGIRYNVLPPRDVKVVGMTQVFSVVTFDLIVTTEGQSYGPCIPLYERAHNLLEGRANHPTSSGLVLTCSRVSGIMYPERESGVEYRHLGGTYTAEAN
jgi:hypothetical protein